MKQMLIRDTEASLNREFAKKIDFTILNAGEFKADTLTEGVSS
jgi:ATP-dependent phosphoenolpyruvate carboxykinase